MIYQKHLKIFAAVMAAAVVFAGCGQTAGTDSSTDTKESMTEMEQTAQAASLKDAYKEDFTIGTCVSSWQVKDEKFSGFIKHHFNSITFENEFKPEALLNKAESQSDPEKYRECPAIDLEGTHTILDFAQENGIAVRGHTLVWHSQTPDWLFYVDYDTEGELCDRELMLKRMENYIKTVMEWTDENYRELIYAWDVVNEAIADEGGMRQSLWYQTVGEDFVERAFEFAAKYRADGVKLFYNDYNAWQPGKQEEIIELVRPAADAGNLDGIGMQSHLTVDCGVELYMIAMKKYVRELNISEIQVTELDVETSGDEAGFKRQETYMRDLMTEIVKAKAEGIPVTNVTVWGTTDELSWKKDKTPLLFNGDMSPKPAYDGFIAGAKAN